MSWFAKRKHYIPSAPRSLIRDIDVPSWTLSEGVVERIAQASYSHNPPEFIGPFQLVRSSPTLKFYRAGNEIIVGVRGTADRRDVASWPSVGLNTFKHSSRYIEDAREMVDFKSDHALDDFKYFAVGHSLGGVVIDEFLKNGLIIEGLSFNPAVQLGDIHSHLRHFRIYKYADPLYILMGQYVDGARVVRGNTSWWEKLVSVIPSYAKLYQIYNAHSLKNFVA